jgi:predicted nucleic acid-binding protein
MKKQKIYIDTSFIGGCLDVEFEKYSNQLLQEFLAHKKIVLISEVLLAEIERAPHEVKMILTHIQNEAETEYLPLNEVISDLSKKYIERLALPPKSFDDARHIATASYYRADVLVSWNFKHIVNLRRIHLINSINLAEGFPSIEITSPREAIDYEE